MSNLIDDQDQFEDLFGADDDVFFHSMDENSQLLESSASTLNVSICSQDSFMELKEDEDARRKSEEEKAKDIAAQRQLLAVEELLESERNYLRLLQLSSGTIRENLLKLQVEKASAVVWSSHDEKHETKPILGLFKYSYLMFGR